MKLLSLLAACLLTSMACTAQFGSIKIPKASDVKKAVDKEIKEEKEGIIKEPNGSASPSREASPSTPTATPSGSSSNSGSSDGSSRSSRDSKTTMRKAEASGELTPRKIYTYVSKVYKREVRYMFTQDVLDVLQNFNRSAYDNGDGKRGSEQGYSDRNAVNDLNKILADYDAWLEQSQALDEFARYKYNDAQNAAAPADKLKAYNQVITACEIIKRISPNNALVEPKLAEVRRLIATVEKSLGNSFTSDFHKAHLNEMVFSAKPFKPGEEASADIRNSFKGGETVYATLYLGRKVRQASDSYAQQPIQVRIDKNLRGLGNIWVTTPMQENSYLQFAIVPGDDWLKENYGPYLENREIFYADFLGNLAKELPLKHEIEVKFDFRASRAEKFKASFSYDMTDGAEGIEKLADNLKNQRLNNTKVPEAGMSNAALEREMLEICQQRFPNDKWKRAIIVSKDWKTITNNLTGVILRRELMAAVLYTNFEGKCGYEYVAFGQVYTGGGKYSNSLRFSSSGGGTYLSCDKVK